MPKRTPVTVYLRVDGSEKYVEAFQTYGVVRSPNRGLSVDFSAEQLEGGVRLEGLPNTCLLYTSPSPRD